VNEELLAPLYDQMLDETNEQIVIGNLLYSPSDVLKAVDPIAYEQGFLDYLDFLITEDERKYP
jgi:hypothetical protein